MTIITHNEMGDGDDDTGFARRDALMTSGRPVQGSDPQGSPFADRVGLRLRFAEAAVWKDLLKTFRAFRLRPTHFAILSIIAEQPGLSQQDLSKQIGLKGPNLVGFLDELAAQVERRQNARDRRSNGLFLTPEGVELLARMTVAHDLHEARVAAVLTDEERVQLIAMLRRIETLGGMAG